ncbi:hypothetical protein CDAR_301611 [Caerostris darwini]|uniref:Uncharacterized protein n=1 Tax=Caerostris darwini TaxID=1538125 RepID=A0AAV4TMS7_9ARAC|nr:hypothetical protein CDAR_301611 [Caerostris darwini]
MSQEVVTTSAEKYRYEPMGGELDNSQGTTSNSVSVVSNNADLTNSFPDDQFVDDLTLKVRSLLKSWEDELPSANISSHLQSEDHVETNVNYSFSNFKRNLETGTTIVSLPSNFSSSTVVHETENSCESLCICNDDKKSDHLEDLRKDFEGCKFNTLEQHMGARSRKFEKNLENSSVSSDLRIHNKSKDNINNNLCLPRISVNKIDQQARCSQMMHDVSSRQTQSVQDPLSYYDFSNVLQDCKSDAQITNKIPEFPPESFSKDEHPILECDRKSVKSSNCIEKRLITKQQNFKSNSLLSASASTDTYSRDSSDRETERSWSEITVVAESFSKSKNNPAKLSSDILHNFAHSNPSELFSIRSSNTLNPSVRVKENILKSSGTYSETYNKVSINDWRFKDADSEKMLCDLDNECQFSNYRPNSSLSDHDTPPLSASSMASSKRLEWDNGADIGYSVLAVSSKVKKGRNIPIMARSEPEGISFINETTTSTASSQVTFPSFTSVSSQETSTSQMSSYLEGVNSKVSSVHESSRTDDLLERSSSPGSLSRSDSKKSVIYNSVKDVHIWGKIPELISPSAAKYLQPQKNSSWPDLTLKTSVPSQDWPAVSKSKLLSKSEEQIGTNQHSKLKPILKNFLFSDLTASRGFVDKSTDSYHISERILPVGDHVSIALQTVPKQIVAKSVSHSCKNCNSPLDVHNNFSNSTHQRSDELQEGDLESYELYSETLNSNQETNTEKYSYNNGAGDWINENTGHDSHYFTELPEFSGYQLQGFHSRPLLLVSNGSSKLEESNFPSIVRNLFENGNSSDHSISGLDAKPHIRWYPFTSTSNLQDIKNVSTQTSMSYIAKQQRDLSVQVSQQTNHKVFHTSNPVNLISSATQFPSTLSKQSNTEASKVDEFLSTPSPSSASSVITNEYNSKINPSERTYAYSLYSPSNLDLVDNKEDHNSLKQEKKIKHSVHSSYFGMNTYLDESNKANERKSCLSREPCANMDISGISSTNLASDEHSVPVNFGDFCSLTRKVTDVELQKFSFSRNQQESFTERMGEDENQTTKSLDNEVSRKNHSGFKVKETRSVSSNSTSVGFNENNIIENLPEHFPFYVNFSENELSRTIPLHQLDYDKSHFTVSHLKEDLNETVPLSYKGDEIIPKRISASSIIKSNKILPEQTTFNLKNVNKNQSVSANTNLSELLSQNPLFTVSEHYDRRMIQKSHSDPFISTQNSNVGLQREKNETNFECQQPFINRKLDLNFNATNDAIHLNKNYLDDGKFLTNSTQIEEKYKYESQQDEFNKNPFTSVSPNTLFYERKYLYNKKNQIPHKKIQQESTDYSHLLEFSRNKNNPFLKEVDFQKRTSKPEDLFDLPNYSDVTDQLQYRPISNVHSRIRDFNKDKNYVSVGVQVSHGVSGSQKCSFCNRTKDSHLNCCIQKEAFKNILNQTLAKRISESKSGTSFCVFSSGCYCCCNKTLQEAFNFHRSELVERIELRRKEAEEKSKKNLFVHIPIQRARKQPVKLKTKAADFAGITAKPFSNKENYKRPKISNSSSLKNGPNKKTRQKNLNKYNRIMTKMYSQILKTETLKGKVNHQRHEILINS